LKNFNSTRAMKAIRLNIEGSWGHFRKAETNNNPLSHDFITKTALAGLIGAVTGVEREPMRAFFPKLCDGLLYNVQLLHEVKKQSWGFTFRQASDVSQQSPRYMEILCRPAYGVLIACRNDAAGEVVEMFERFSHSVQQGRARFTPVLGLHNCPADLLFEAMGEVSNEGIGTFETAGFISKAHQLDLKNSASPRFGFEKIPTYQNDDFWNLPERYETVVYPNAGSTLRAEGHHFSFQANGHSSQWVLI